MRAKSLLRPGPFNVRPRTPRFYSNIHTIDKDFALGYGGGHIILGSRGAWVGDRFSNYLVPAAASFFGAFSASARSPSVSARAPGGPEVAPGWRLMLANGAKPPGDRPGGFIF